MSTDSGRQRDDRFAELAGTQPAELLCTGELEIPVRADTASMTTSPEALGTTADTAARVIVADDNALIRAGLRLLLRIEFGWEVVSEAENGRQALTLCEELQPDLVLMDVHMPIMDGLRATRAIKDAWPAVRVVIMTSDRDDSTRSAAIAARADGFVIKSVNTSDFVAAIRTLLGGPSANVQQLANAVGEET